MKKSKKIFVILMILLIISITLSMSTEAAISLDKIKVDSNEGANEIATVGGYIYTSIANVGIILSVVMIAVLGVKYILGSADERAEYKKSMIPYLVGAILVFAASTIVDILINVWD